MSGSADPVGAFLCVCLNPVIQKTLVYDRIERGEVNRTSRWRIDAAGKGICPTRILTQLGERATCFCQLGGPTRDWFLSLCTGDGLAVEWIDSGSPIRFCTTLVEQGHRSATELVEEAAPVAPGTTERLIAAFERILPGYEACLFSGTVARGFAPGIMATLAGMACAAGKRLYLDIKGRDLKDCLPLRPVVVKPNLEELAATMGVGYAEVRGERAARDLVERAGREFFDRYGTRLVVTRGDASTLYWDGSALGEQPVDKVAVVNPIGSGDAFGAGVARTLERGGGLAEAVAAGTGLGGRNAATLKPGSLTD